MKCLILTEWSGKTVKSYLFGALKLSRAQVIVLKKREDGILLNGERVFVSAVLAEGDILSLALEDRENAESIQPSDIPVTIIYEDDDYAAVNKPPFMPTHPSLNHYTDTLANALAAHYMKKGIPFVYRAANRLDRDTSGVVLVSKNKRAAAAIADVIAGRKADKQYIALLDGELETDAGTIDRNIVRAEKSMILRRTDDLLGEKAVTEYKVIAKKNGKTLVWAFPRTGRTHQLRVHFSYIGHPITGDTLYGKEDETIKRQALHAASLTFIHPLNGKTVNIKAPLPDDIKVLLEENGFEKDLEQIESFYK